MIGRSFTVLAAASALLCVGTCVLWVRSLSAVDAIEFREGGVSWRVASHEGVVRVDNRPQVVADEAKRSQRTSALLAELQRIESARQAVHEARHRAAGVERDGMRAIDDIPDTLPLLSRALLLDLRSGLLTAFGGRMWAGTRESWHQLDTLDAEFRPLWDQMIALRAARTLAVERVAVRHALLAAGFGVLPLAWVASRFVRRRRRRKRAAGGLCPRCGYDTRASTAVCSECGFGLQPGSTPEPASPAAPAARP